MTATILFWIAWGIISVWVLKTFYVSPSKKKLERLRKAALGINLSVLILSFLPWVSQNVGAKSGVTLALEGNSLAVLFFVLLIGCILLFLTKSPSYLKLASSLTIGNTVILFALMMLVRPETFTLSLFDIAPVAAILLLLTCDSVVLLLWQQLQLKEKGIKKKYQNQHTVVRIAGTLVVIIFFAWIVFQNIQPRMDPGKRGIEIVSQFSEVKRFKTAIEESGRSVFGIDIASKPTAQEPYYLIQVFEVFPDHKTTFGWYRYDPKSGNVYRQDIANDRWEKTGY